MRILLVHEIDYLNKPFFEFQEFAEGLSGRGHQVSVLHVQEFSDGEATKLSRLEEIYGLHVPYAKLHLYSPSFVVRGIFSRFLAIAEHLRLLVLIFVTNRPDIVLSYSVPTSGISVAILGKLFGVPVVHRAIDVSHLLRHTVLSPLVRCSESLTFRLSDHVSTHNKALQNYILRTIGDRGNTSIEFPPVYPSKGMEMARRGPRREKELRIIFIGSLAHFTEIEPVITSLAEHKGREGVRMRIVGSGPKETELKKLVETLELESQVDFRGWKNREGLAAELEWADIGVVPFSKNRLTECSLPQKAIEYLSAGLSVVSVKLEGAESVFGEFRGAYFVDSPSDVLDECIRVARLAETTEVEVAKIRKLFDRDQKVRGMENLLRKVVRERRK